MDKSNILVVGASSGIARAVLDELAELEYGLVLAGRDRQELEKSAADLRLRHQVETAVLAFDALDYDSHQALLEEAGAALSGGLEGVILCHGFMIDQDMAEHDFAQARRMLDVNLLSMISVLQEATRYLEQRGGGFLAAISSVAGDRGRQSNFIYGAAKAGLTVYLSGLRNRMHPKGIHVLTIKPGFVDTIMTQGKINPNSPLLVSPERVAKDIVRAIRRRQDVLYTPWFWRYIMLIIRLIPEPLFKRLKL